MHISALFTASSKSVLQSALVGQPPLSIMSMPSCKTVSTTLSTTQFTGDRLAIPAIDRRISAGFTSQQDQQDGDFMKTSLHARARMRAHARTCASPVVQRLARLADGSEVPVYHFDFTVAADRSGRYDCLRALGVGERLIVANGDDRVASACANIKASSGRYLRTQRTGDGLLVERLA